MEGLSLVLQSALQGTRADPHFAGDIIACRLAIRKALHHELANHQGVARRSQLRHALFRGHIVHRRELCIGSDQYAGYIGLGKAQGQMRCIERRGNAESVNIHGGIRGLRVHEFNTGRNQIRARNPAQEFERSEQREFVVLPLHIDDAGHQIDFQAVSGFGSAEACT